MVWGLGFRVSVLGFRFGLGLQGFGFGFGFGVQSLGVHSDQSDYQNIIHARTGPETHPGVSETLLQRGRNASGRFRTAALKRNPPDTNRAETQGASETAPQKPEAHQKTEPRKRGPNVFGTVFLALGFFGSRGVLCISTGKPLFSKLY